MKQTNQSGFSTVEAIVIVVVVGLIGFAGWFVWQRQHVKQEATKVSTMQQNDTPNSSLKTTNFLIKEWGVAAPYAGDLDLQYEINGNEAVFSTSPLSNLYAGCKGYGGSIVRYDMTELEKNSQDGPFGTPDNTTKIIGTYGYGFMHAQTECAASNPPDAAFTAHEPEIKVQITKSNNAVEDLVKNLEDVSDCVHEPELSAPCAKKMGVY